LHYFKFHTFSIIIIVKKKTAAGVYSRTSTRADWMKKTVCETFNDNDAELCGGGGNDPVPAPVIAPTATPVIKPTSPPDVGGGGCDGKGGKEFVIELTTDEYPQDTSYVVKDLGTKKNILVGKNFNTRYKLYKVRNVSLHHFYFQSSIVLYLLTPKFYIYIAGIYL
jgi:hypothetical protein